MTDINKTGPSYPLPPAAGTNAVGAGKIGVAQIGDIAPFSFWDTVQSEYANSPIITSLISSFAAALDQTENFQRFYDDIWNIETAQDYGLDVWGRIVGVNRVLHLPSIGYFGFAEALPGSLPFNTNVRPQLSPSLGFAEAGSSWQTFGHGVFGLHYDWIVTPMDQGGGSYYNGGALTSNFRLETESYRRLIMAKAAYNITDCSIPAINRLLLNLFPSRGNAYITDSYQGGSYFGFAESSNAQTFGEGVFYNGETTATMVMAYVFDFPLTSVELAIVTQSGVLPRPTGVHASVIVNGQTVLA